MIQLCSTIFQYVAKEIKVSILQEYLYIYMFCGIIHKNQDVKSF